MQAMSDRIAAARLPIELDRKLDSLAEQTRRTRSGVLRLLVEAATPEALGAPCLKGEPAGTCRNDA